MPAVKLPEMTPREVEEVLQNNFLCRIGFKGSEDSHPYISPFVYVYVHRTMYFFMSDYGKKVAYLKKDASVCVEVESTTPDLSNCSFLSLRGTLQVVSVQVERSRAIEQIRIMAKERNLSPNFLIALGLQGDAGWGSLTHEAPLIVVKLANIVEQVGLKI